MKSLLKICIILCIVSSTIAEKRVVCYWDSTSTRHDGLQGYFSVANIDPTICTHIIYTYIRFLQSVVIVPNYNEDTINSFIRLKQQNPAVKLLIGVGGPEQKAQIPSIIASTATDRTVSGQRVKEFVDKFGFDGVDFDWQYPGQGTGTSSEDKANYVKLLSAWRNILTNSKILSISVAAKQKDIDASYDIASIVSSVDFINLNSFDLRGSSSDNITAFHSPYRKETGESGVEAEFNAESIVNNWIARGCPASKLTLGIATYGRSYTLSDIRQTGVGAPVNGIGRVSHYLSNNAGLVPYAEICYNLKNNNNWTGVFDDGHFANYAVFDDDQWVSFDTKETVLAKIHLAIDKGLSGVNYATIDRDDYSNQCGGGNFPLINIGYDGIINDDLDENPILIQPEPISTTTQKPTTTTTTQKPTTTTTTTKKTTTTFVPAVTSPQTTRSTSTTTKLPGENTPPIYTGPTVPKDDDDLKTTSPSTTTRRTTTAANAATDFPTPPTLNGLSDISSSSPTSAAQTTVTEVRTEAPTITAQSTTESTTKKKTTKTTTTQFPTPPVTPSTVG